MDLLLNGDFGELPASEDALAGAFRGALAAFAPAHGDASTLLARTLVLNIREETPATSLETTFRRLLDLLRGKGGPPSDPNASPPPAVPA